MSISPGTRFGSYQVAEPIGSGGMGEVYRARDAQLGRDVAIKVLPASFSSDALRVARFEQEAKTLASLNHSNIAHIYGLERSDGSTGIVMELVDGATLAERIGQGPVPIEDALRIAAQIADALDAAHERGIVHRDLKPANVKVKPDGAVKVLDFGIAKALDPRFLTGPGPAALTTPAMTEAGMVLGTAAYMSPEQARGKVVDQRTGVWAFGCVLYEMLTGRPAFLGEDVTSTLARVLEVPANLDALPPGVSPAVRRTLELCFEKDARTRIADMRDVKLALAGRFETQGPRAEERRAAASPWRRALPLAAAFVAGSAAVGLVGLSIWPRLAPAPKLVTRFVHALPEGQALAAPTFGGTNDLIGLSPDGRTLAYSSVGGLRLRDMATLEEREIRTDQAIGAPTFSPDGRSIAYFSNGVLVRRDAAAGSLAATVTDRALRGTLTLSWAPDDTILMTEVAGILRVPATGGTREVVVASEGSTVAWPQLLPDGDTVLFTHFAANTPTSAEIVVQSISTGESTVVVARGAGARYVPTGHLVYALGDTLFGIAFDTRTKRTIGGAVPLVEGMAQLAQFEIANDGTLAYVRGILSGASGPTLVWVDRAGRKTPLRLPARGYTYLALSPDETRVALDIRDQETGTWVLDLEHETLQRLTFDPGQNRGVVWSTDSRRIAFSRQLDDGEEIYWQAADGSGVPEALTRGSGFPAFPIDFTPDGAALLYTTAGLPRRTYMISVGGAAGAGTPLLAGPASEGSPAVSPDGRWLAYVSDESGSYEVYVRPFPDVAAARWQISSGGGYHPHWSRGSGELFYLEGDGAEVAMMVVPLESGETFRQRAAVELFRGEFAGTGPIVGPDVYDVSADGQRFLMLALPPATETPDVRPDIVIVQNWFEELKRLVPVE
jgi:serine/threonine-protein kinase